MLINLLLINKLREMEKENWVYNLDTMTKAKWTEKTKEEEQKKWEGRGYEVLYDNDNEMCISKEY